MEVRSLSTLAMSVENKATGDDDDDVDDDYYNYCLFATSVENKATGD